MEIEITSVALLEFAISNQVEVIIEVEKPDGDVPPNYYGEKIVTPTEETQILETKNRIVNDNIVINPIPSNYGRISYNGAYLTVE